MRILVAVGILLVMLAPGALGQTPAEQQAL